jgi:PAS domain S-box-containing protein
MRHKKRKIIFIISGFISFVLFHSPVLAKSEIYAVGCIDNYPYEFIGDDGNASGFSVDIVKNIADKLNVKCRIDLVPYESFILLQNNPDVDMILGMIRGDPNSRYHFFRPNMKINFSIFADSASTISSINDLHGLKIIISAHDSISNPVLHELKKFLKFKHQLNDNEVQAFTQLKSSEADAVFMSGSSARQIISSSNLIGIKELPVNTGFFDYGFGLRRNNEDILNIITAGYERIFQEGDYERIYRKWFVPESDENLFSKNGVYLSGGIFGFIVFIIFLLINSLILRKRIKEKTENLNISMNELNKAQVQLRESEKRFRRIFNQSPSALMILNPAGRVLMFNEAVVDIFGVNNPEELINLDIINSPLSTEWFKTRLKDYRNINLEVKFNFEIIRQTGYYSTSKTGIMILEIIIMPVEIHAGSPEPGYICQFSDNTQERLLLEEIKYNQRKLEMIFEGIKDGLWEWNILTGRVRYNRKFFSFLGYKPELYPDDITTLLGFIHESDRDTVKQELFEKALNGRNFNIEYRMLMSNGNIINVKSRGETIEWDDNLKPVRVIGLQTEITAKRNLSGRIEMFKNDASIKDFSSDNIQCSCIMENMLNGRVILMADDNYLIFMHISELLKKYRAETLYASSGSEAFEILKNRGDISLVILDHHMPGLDGFSALKEIRKINSNIPVIIQTGECHENGDDFFLREGFDGMLSKPVDESLLIETVCGLVNSG